MNDYKRPSLLNYSSILFSNQSIPSSNISKHKVEYEVLMLVNNVLCFDSVSVCELFFLVCVDESHFFLFRG